MVCQEKKGCKFQMGKRYFPPITDYTMLMRLDSESWDRHG